MLEEGEIEITEKSYTDSPEAPVRDKGRFCRKNIYKWKQNIRIANKRRHVEVIPPQPAFPSDGRRIVEIEKLATDMFPNLPMFSGFAKYFSFQSQLTFHALAYEAFFINYATFFRTSLTSPIIRYILVLLKSTLS